MILMTDKNIFNSVQTAYIIFKTSKWYIIHLMTAHEGNICFVARESQLDSRETKQMFPEGAVIKCFVI